MQPSSTNRTSTGLGERSLLQRMLLARSESGVRLRPRKKEKGGNDQGPALLHMLWNLYASGYDMHTGGSVTYVMND